MITGFFRSYLLLHFNMIACLGIVSADELDVVVSPRVTVVEREGITGGGYPLQLPERALIIYPNHPDDFGVSAGTGSAFSADGGISWTQGEDGWPMEEMVDLWIDRLKNGDLMALGIHWTPDPKKRREVVPQTVPDDAYRIGISDDSGKKWTFANASIDCPLELGVIARPLPHIIEEKNGALLMPAYAWSKGGNRSLLLRSQDQGRHWSVYSIITTAIAMNKAGSTVTTPWLETTVSSTQNGDLLAIVRTGSTSRSPLISVRSHDGGKTWETPEKLSFAGKLPTLQLLPNGVLTLVTAQSKNHCRLYLSEDGTGRIWSKAYIISSLTGGNVGMTVAGRDKLLITTPANRRVDAWSVQIAKKPLMSSELTAPSNIKMTKVSLSWTPSPKAVAYRVTPILIKPGPGYSKTKIFSYAPIQTGDVTPKLKLGRQILPNSTYAFEIQAVDATGRVSPIARSQNFHP